MNCKRPQAPTGAWSEQALSNAKLGRAVGSTRVLVCSALLIALGVLIPTVFHQFGIAGPIFLPMHFPVIIAGLMFGPLCGLIVGLCSPALSFSLTGMPPPPLLFAMIPELITYGGVCGCLRRELRAPVFVSLVGGMAAGRFVLGLAVWALAGFVDFHATPWGFVKGAIVTGLPGIGGQAVLIPLLVRRLSNRSVPQAE